MAVNPLVQGPTPTAPVATSLDAAAVLSALKTGQAVDAVVLAKLETGEARLATLGVLLDIMPVEPVDLGDALRLTVVRTGDNLAVSVAKAPLPDRQGLPPASAPPPASPSPWLSGSARAGVAGAAGSSGGRGPAGSGVVVGRSYAARSSGGSMSFPVLLPGVPGAWHRRAGSPRSPACC